MRRTLQRRSQGDRSLLVPSRGRSMGTRRRVRWMGCAQHCSRNGEARNWRARIGPARRLSARRGRRAGTSGSSWTSSATARWRPPSAAPSSHSMTTASGRYSTLPATRSGHGCRSVRACSPQLTGPPRTRCRYLARHPPGTPQPRSSERCSSPQPLPPLHACHRRVEGGVMLASTPCRHHALRR
jgi:hypothetical protein